MKDELVSFETAKLAKEKGFDELAQIIYYDPPKLDRSGHYIKAGPGYARKYNYYTFRPKDGSERIHGTTQSLLQRWLREVHKIDIVIEGLSTNQYMVTIQKLVYNNKPRLVGFKSYEEALEAGLKQALELV